MKNTHTYTHTDTHNHTHLSTNTYSWGLTTQSGHILLASLEKKNRFGPFFAFWSWSPEAWCGLEDVLYFSFSRCGPIGKKGFHQSQAACKGGYKHVEETALHLFQTLHFAYRFFFKMFVPPICFSIHGDTKQNGADSKFALRTVPLMGSVYADKGLLVARMSRTS